MDWILSFVGLLGFYLSGKKIWWAWYLNIGTQTLWFTYGIITKQYGFIVASVLYAIVFSRNAYLWTKEHKKEKASDRHISGESSEQ